MRNIIRGKTTSHLAHFVLKVDYFRFGDSLFNGIGKYFMVFNYWNHREEKTDTLHPPVNTILA